jgi:hypothetical protein
MLISMLLSPILCPVCVACFQICVAQFSVRGSLHFVVYFTTLLQFFKGFLYFTVFVVALLGNLGVVDY